MLQADSVFDVVPGDICSSTILAACAATAQVSHQCTMRCCLVCL